MDFDIDSHIYSTEEIGLLYTSAYDTYVIFHHYISKNSKLIEEIKNNISAEYQKYATKGQNLESLELEFSDILNIEYLKFKEINYKTMVLHIYSFLESNLRELAITVKEKRNLQLSYKDIKADDQSLKLFKKYFEKCAEIKFSIKTLEKWEKLGKYQIVRNAIAHNYMCDWGIKPLPDNIKKLSKLIDSTSLLSKYENTFTITKEKFLFNFLELVNGFLIELFNAIDEKCK